MAVDEYLFLGVWIAPHIRKCTIQRLFMERYNVDAALNGFVACAIVDRKKSDLINVRIEWITTVDGTFLRIRAWLCCGHRACER